VPNAEIDAIREMLASSPCPAGLSERRKWLGGRYPLREDMWVEATDANGVAAEWTMTPEAEQARVILFLHGGGYVSDRSTVTATWSGRPDERRPPAP